MLPIYAAGVNDLIICGAAASGRVALLELPLPPLPWLLRFPWLLRCPIRGVPWLLPLLPVLGNLLMGGAFTSAGSTGNGIMAAGYFALRG